jgi:hypothetical protein
LSFAFACEKAAVYTEGRDPKEKDAIPLCH